MAHSRLAAKLGQNINAQQVARANVRDCHASCRARSHAIPSRGSSLTFGKMKGPPVALWKIVLGWMGVALSTVLIVVALATGDIRIGKGSSKARFNRDTDAVLYWTTLSVQFATTAVIGLFLVAVTSPGTRTNARGRSEK